MKIQVL